MGDVCLAAAQTSDAAAQFAAPWLQDKTRGVAEARRAREELLSRDPRYASMTDDEIQRCEEQIAAAIEKAKADEAAARAERAANFGMRKNTPGDGDDGKRKPLKVKRRASQGTLKAAKEAEEEEASRPQ